MMFSVIIFQIDILGGVGDEVFFFLESLQSNIPTEQSIYQICAH